jgi:FSR family fosmidomycin resistance protein-like MFS transporter
MPPARADTADKTAWTILIGISLCHLINDVLQSVIAAIYPLLRDEFALTFFQIGLLTAAFQVTASLFQPVIGLMSDRKPAPMLLSFGMILSLAGVLAMAWGGSYPTLLAGTVVIGMGSAIFHPDASRVARMASGGRFGTAQSLFQVGGNAGTAIGPILAAFLVVPLGRDSVAWLGLLALTGIVLLWRTGLWYAGMLAARASVPRTGRALPLSRGKTGLALGALIVLTLTKSFYSASILSYYTFFVIERFGVSTQGAQLMLFLFLGGMAAGVALGGPVGDRFGARVVIWVSILGVLPFTLMLPYADLFWTAVLSVVIGLVISAAFPAILVFAQDLLPGRIGLVAGLFFGFSFGVGGLASALLGVVADSRGIEHVFWLCSFLPLLGLLTALLPSRRALAGDA